MQRRDPSLHTTACLRLTVSVADVAIDVTAPDACWPVSNWTTAINLEQLAEPVTDRASMPRSERSSSLNASESGGRGTAAMLSFSSFSIRDILSGRVTRGGGVRAVWDSCASDSGFKDPALTHRVERHSKRHSPLSPDAFSDETAGGETAEREGEFKTFLSE